MTTVMNLYFSDKERAWKEEISAALKRKDQHHPPEAQIVLRPYDVMDCGVTSCSL